LREIIRAAGGGRSVASLEDPIEAVVEGVAQSQINPAAGFDLLTALRSLLRQDPEVILVGEIRDAEVAKVAYQAAMTGQLVVTTFHASDAADAIARLLDMGIPPYVVRGATRLVVAQRLLRRVCERCHSIESVSTEQHYGNQLSELNHAASVGDQPCQACRGTGYVGRIPATEAVDLQRSEIADAVLRRADASRLRKLFANAGDVSLLENARTLLEEHKSSRAELVRVFGLTALGGSGDGD
jgi:general secretion pathway protein E